MANDARGMRLSVYSRAMVMDEGAVWTARRFRNDAVRRAYFLQVEAVRALRRLPGFAALRPLAPGTRDIMGA